VKIGGLVNVFVVFVLAGYIVYMLSVVVSFIVVFLFCVCALLVCICVTCLLYCCTTATGLKPNCSLTNIYIVLRCSESVDPGPKNLLQNDIS
jgi:hypothetical protein